MVYRFIVVILLLVWCVIPAGSESGSAAVETLKIPGLNALVDIYRDDFGTPYIIAKNEHDLFFAHGYLQATDRLFQLDGIRRVPQADTSELLGSDMLDMDMMFAELGLDRVAKKSLEMLSPESRAMLEAFSDGVNAYITQCGSVLPLEFTILNYKPKPWTPYDSLCVMRLVGWWLSVGMSQELFYNDLVESYGNVIADQLFQGVPPRAEIDRAVKAKIKQKEKAPILKPFKPRNWREYFPGPPRGTNAWVISGSKTKSGKPILANDPHLELFCPAIWYEVGLSCPEWSEVGIVFPGLPVPLIGTNGKIAWGAAAFPTDSQDLYREKVNPSNKYQYEYNGKWLDYNVMKFEIPVKGGKPVSFEVRESIHGPVVSKQEKENLALRWTGFEPSDDIVCFKHLTKASNVSEFREAFRDFLMTSQHFMAFDTAGKIIQVMPGRIPIRDGFNGDLPHPEGDPKYEWSGYIPYNEMPSPINPIEGFLNNSNNFPSYCEGIDLGTTFPLPVRSDRVKEILSSRNDFTPDDMVEMEMDTLNPVAREILPMMLSRIDGLDTKQFDGEINLLKNWDYRESPDSVAATIYNEWWVELPKHIFIRKLGLNSLTYRDYVDQCTLAMEELMTDGPNSSLWNWLEIGSKEDFKLTCFSALGIAVQTLAKDYGPDRANWAWGIVHKTHFAHPSKVKFLLDGGSYGVGGSRYSLLVSHYYPSMGFESTFGPSYRIVATIDARGRITAKSVLPPGNWAAPLSPHFKDQAQMWVDGKMKDLRVYPDEMIKLPLSFKMAPE